MIKPRKGEIRKPTKSISGVTPVAVVLKPQKCKHGTCLYCPTLSVPQSYTPLSPAIIRAKNLDYDAYKQVKARLKAFKLMNHPTDKIELIVMGGTFFDYPGGYQSEFIKQCYDALNGKKAGNLEEAKKINETARHRCIALCLETRPDSCSSQDIKRALEFGCTRIELGVQAIDDKIYKKVNRGHTVKDVVDTTRRLKKAGFKIGYHLMPGLPGSSFKDDINMLKKLFSDSRFKPDQLKIYPCQVIKGSKLTELYFKGKYKPYTDKELEKLLISVLKIVPRYCRIMRIMREIPPVYLIAGTKRIDLRQEIEGKLRKEQKYKEQNKIKEIRFREIGFVGKDINKQIKLKTTQYQASQGKEYFLEIVNKDDVLFGLLRLRIDKNDKDRSKNAIIRELHVYGKALKIGKSGRELGQHKGFGKWLMQEAEKIVKKQGCKKIKVISGVGVREYYSSKIGYHLDKQGIYMVKSL